MGNSQLEEIKKQTEETLKNSESIISKLSCLNLLIQLRRLLGEDSGENLNYRDTKLIIKYIISSVDEAIYGYDHIDLSVLEKMINHFEIERRYNLYCYLVRQLILKGFEEEANGAKKLCSNAEIKLVYEVRLKGSDKFQHFLKLASIVCAYNIYTVLIALTFIVLISAVVTLPAFADIFAIYELSYHQYVDNFYMNHFLNIISSLISFSNDFKIVPLNALAFLLLVFAKIFGYLIILNFLIREVEKKIGF